MNHQRDLMVQLIPVETDSFVLPRMLTFSKMKSRETSNPIDPVTKEIKTVTLGIFHNMPLKAFMQLIYITYFVQDLGPNAPVSEYFPLQ